MTNIIQAVWHALGKGLNAAIVKDALALVESAAASNLSNDSAREFVVDILVRRGIPESVARLAVELALQLFKTRSSK